MRRSGGANMQEKGMVAGGLELEHECDEYAPRTVCFHATRRNIVGRSYYSIVASM